MTWGARGKFRLELWVHTLPRPQLSTVGEQCAHRMQHTIEELMMLLSGAQWHSHNDGPSSKAANGCLRDPVQCPGLARMVRLFLHQSTTSRACALQSLSLSPSAHHRYPYAFRRASSNSSCLPLPRQFLLYQIPSHVPSAGQSDKDPTQLARTGSCSRENASIVGL